MKSKVIGLDKSVLRRNYMQSNAPEIEALLRNAQENKMPSKPALKSHIRDFATPVKAKSKASSRHKSHAPGKENKMASLSEKEVSFMSDFSTPRRSSTTRPSIILKEKLSSPVLTPSIGVHSKSRAPASSGVPTAHVFPVSGCGNSLEHAQQSLSHHTQWAEPALSSSDPRRVNHESGQRSLVNGYNNLSYASQSETSIPGSQQPNDSLFRPSLSTITAQSADNEFHTLMHDPDQTMDQSRFLTGGGVDRSDIFARGSTDTALVERDRNDVSGRVHVTNSREGSDILRQNHAPPTRVENTPHPYSSQNGSSSSYTHSARSHSSHNSLAMTDPNLHSQSSYPYAQNTHPKDYSSYSSQGSAFPYERPGSSMSATMPNQASFQAIGYGGSIMSGGSGSMGYHTMPPMGGGGVGGPHPPPDGHYSNGELALWQHQHREQLRRQQLEAAQPLYRSIVGGSSASSVTSLLTSDPNKLDSVRRAADNIIHEKDTIIERQKLKLLELERQNTKVEADMQQRLLSRLHHEGDNFSVQLQGSPRDSTDEKQYEAASLKAQMAQLVSNNDSSLAGHEKKLAAREYEIEELKKELEKERQKHKRETEENVAKMIDKDALLLEWKDKHASLRDQCDELERKNRQLERYMQDLPTLDEQASKNAELRTLKEDKHRYKSKAAKNEAKVKELLKGIESRDALIQSLEETQDDLKVQLDTLHDGKVKLLSEVKRLREGGATIPEEDLEELRHENRCLHADLDKARKILEGKHKKLQQSDVNHQQELSQIQDRLAQEENTVTGLKEEIENKEEHLNQLRDTLKLLSAENQDLLDTKFKLQDKINEFEKQHTGEAQKYEKRLMKEMGVTFRELQSMVQICMQHAEGEDPNISSLLGVKASTSSCEYDQDEPVGDNIQALKYKLSKVKELQAQVDSLREMLSNKYAEDWGQNINCAQQ